MIQLRDAVTTIGLEETLDLAVATLHVPALVLLSCPILKTLDGKPCAAPLRLYSDTTEHRDWPESERFRVARAFRIVAPALVDRPVRVAFSEISLGPTISEAEVALRDDFLRATRLFADRCRLVDATFLRWSTSLLASGATGILYRYSTPTGFRLVLISNAEAESIATLDDAWEIAPVISPPESLSEVPPWFLRVLRTSSRWFPKPRDRIDWWSKVVRRSPPFLATTRFGRDLRSDLPDEVDPDPGCPPTLACPSGALLHPSVESVARERAGKTSLTFRAYSGLAPLRELQEKHRAMAGERSRGTSGPPPVSILEGPKPTAIP